MLGTTHDPVNQSPTEAPHRACYRPTLLGLSQDSVGSVAIEQMVTACEGGQVAGAPLKVVRLSAVPSNTSEDQQVSRDLAEELKRVLRTRPNRNASDHLNTAPQVVPLHVTPALWPFLLPQSGGQPAFPLMLVDLMDDDTERAGETLDAFVKAGMVVDRRLGHSMFPFPPEGWSHLTWSSQVLILAGDEDGRTRKVLFEPCNFSKDWLAAVDASAECGIGLVVANLAGQPFNADVLKAKSVAGELVVCFVPGMLAGEPA